MQLVPVRTAVIRTAILLCVVVALDAAAALFIAKPVLWCARIPTLIPLFTPFVLMTWRGKARFEHGSRSPRP